MMRSGLLVVTLATVLVTGLVVPRSAWLGSHSAHHADGPVRGRDSLSSEAGWRWQQGQPTHWRACLLQH
jgi:hypothetical protein